MMASGKTTIGRAVARRLRRPFVDSDAQIETRTGKTVREIFEREGEPAFRKLETEALRDALAVEEPCVIAAAGGVVLSEENRRMLEAGGHVVWLRADPGLLAGRVRAGDHRPLLDDDPAVTMRRLAAEREPLYELVADTVLDVDRMTKSEIVRAVEAVAP